MLIDFWFGLIVVLWCGYIALEGFDFGVGMLLPLIGHDERERKSVLATIGPVWDGNEVWLIVAGGATFAAFPEWYSTLFAGYYLPLVLVLLGLILRGAGIELRGKAASAGGRAWADRAIVVGSALPALLWGVAFADFIRGVPLDSAYTAHASLWYLLNPYALLGGVTSLLLFAAHGAHFLELRTTGRLRDRTLGYSTYLNPAACVAAVLFIGSSWLERGDALTYALGTGAAFALVYATVARHRGQDARALAGTSATCVLVTVFVFASCWPYAIVGHGTHSLTLTEAASAAYTLKVMTVVAIVMTPVVLAYQAYSYWIFRQRISLPPVVDGEPAPVISLIPRQWAHRNRSADLTAPGGSGRAR